MADRILHKSFLVLVGMLAAHWLPGAAAAQVPFACTGEAFIVQNINAELSQVDQTTSPFTFEAIGSPAGTEYNNMGFRRTDGFLYAVELSSAGNVQILRIDSTGATLGLGRPAGLPTGPRFDAGDITPDGDTMYINTVNQDLYAVDLTSLPTLPPVTAVNVTGDSGFVFDWTYNPDDGRLYGGDSTQGQLAILDPATGVRTDVGVGGCAPVTPDCTASALPSTVAYGGAWFNAAGRLFLYRNNGVIFEIDLSGPTIVRTQTGPGSSRNDAAACVQNITGAAKQMTVTDDGLLPETVTITYNFTNLSATEDLFELTAPDDLEAVFGTHGVDWTFTSISSVPAAFANPGFDGHSDPELVNQAPVQTLAPGATSTITVEIEVLSLDALNPDGLFCNQVLVTGRTDDGIFFGDLSTAGLDPDPNGDGSPDERELSCVDLSDLVFPAIDLVKTGVLNAGADGVADPGDPIDYAFTVTNTGSVTLTGVAVTDPQVPAITCPGGNPIPSLAPGASEVCTGSYAITQADINAAVVDNTATATADDPDGNPVSDSDSHSEPIAQAPAITLVKEGELEISGEPAPPAIDLVKSGVLDLGGDGVATSGDVVTYSFQITNTGGVTLTDVAVSDPLVSPISCSSGHPIPSLTPLETETCTGTYAITQADVDAGVRDNTATVSGDDPGGNPVTAQDSHSLPIGAPAALEIVKTGALDLGGDGEATVGDFIDYTLEVTNVGAVTLTAVTVSDPLMAITCPGGNPIAVLAPAASVTCIGSYAITQADIDAGVRDNIATAEGLDPDLALVADSDSHSEIIPAPGALVPFPCSGDAYIVQNVDAQLTLIDQSVSPFVFVPIGGPTGRELNNLGFRETDGLMYAVELTSGGNVQIVQIDATGTVNGLGRPAGLPTGPRFDAGDVSVDGSTMFITTVGQALYKVSLAAVPSLPPVSAVSVTGAAGFVFDWAASPLDGMLYGGDSTQGQLAILDPVTGVRTDVAVAGLPSGTAYGGAWFDSNGILFLYRNNGEIYEIDLAGPTILSVQSGPGSTRNDGAACAAAALAPPAARRADLIDKPAGDGDKTYLPRAAKASSPTQADPGDVINYTFEVTNTGNVPLTDVTVSDPMVSPIVCPSGAPGTPNLIPVLNPGESETCIGSYAITQEDVDNGFKLNVATATGEDPNGDPVTDDDDHTEPIPQEPAIDLVKNGVLDDGGDGFGDVGDTIDYTFTVTNAGNVTLSDVVVSDPIVSPIACPGGNPIATMAPGASLTCTGSYVLTQADVDAGVRDNTATATGQDPGGDPVSDTDVHSEPIPQPAAIDLVKTGALADGGDGVADAGDVIVYSFLVTNTGGVTLTAVSVTDPLVSPITCPKTTLAPGASMTCTGSYVLTQADVDAGVRDNLATATGDDPDGNPVSDDDVHSEPLPPAPGIRIVKDGELAGDVPPALQGGGGAMPGDEIAYTFVVTNVGNVTLTDVTVTDPIVSPIICPSGNPIPSLAPGESETCQGIYVVTQEDVDLGQRVNVATAAGDPPTGPPVEDEDDHTEPLDQLPAIDLVKDGTFDDGGDGAADPGDLIDYTFVVTNTGNVTLTGVTVTDPIVTSITCPVTTLAPGASRTCTGSYAITQADVDAGVRDNTATATGDDPQGDPVSDTDSHSEPLAAGAAIDLVKDGTLDLGANGASDPGDVIDYTFVVTNTGGVTLTGVTVTDPLVSPITCPATTLAPGESTTCTGSYAITQADIDAGVRDNTATAAGTPANGDPDVSDVDDHSEPIPVPASISLVKDGALDLGGDGVANAGDLIDYTFVVTNTGGVTLTGVTVTDPIVSSITCPQTTLAPGESMTCTGSYAITQADVDAGERVNTATATGDDPGGNPVEDDDTHVEPIGMAPAIDLEKTGTLDLGGDGVANPGDVITYQLTVTNTGNVTLTAIAVTDPMLADIACPSATAIPNLIPSLAPGASETCTGTYAITQEDVDNGEKCNTASVEGQCTEPVSDSDSICTPIPQAPALELVKDGDLDLGDDEEAGVGDLIDYTFAVTNAGNVTLTDVQVSDPLISAITCPSADPGTPDVIPTLAPGVGETCTGSYEITQDDIDAGVRDNVATAAGSDPDGDPVEDSDDHSEPIPEPPVDSVCLPTVDFDTGGGGAGLPAGTIVDNEYVALGMHVGTDDPAHPAMIFDTANPTGGDDDLGTPNQDFGGPGVGSGGGLGEVGANAVALGKVLILSADGDSGDPDDHSGGGTLIFQFDFPVFVDAVAILDVDAGETGGTVEAFDAVSGGTPVASAAIADLGDNSVQTVFLGAADVRRLEVTFAGSGAVSALIFCADPSTIDLQKDGELDLGADGSSDVGDLIDYTFTVTNTGDLPLSSVAVSDPLVPSIDCPSGNPIPTLAAGASETCTGTYAITQADVDAGVRDNVATAAGTDPLGQPVTDDDDHSEPVPPPCVPEPEDCSDGEDNDCDGDVDGDDADCVDIEPGDFCTFTQGGWGNGCQRPDPCSGGNPGCFRDCHFDSLTNSDFGLLSGDLQIGGVDGFGIIDGDECYSILLTAAKAVESYLPSSGGGGNSPLDEDHVDPLTTASANLGTQVVAATLNVQADAQGLRFDGDSGPFPPGTLGTLIFGDCVSASLQGLSVDELLDLAHGVLSSCDPGNEGLIGDLKDALGDFNECFVECKSACGCLSLP